MSIFQNIIWIIICIIQACFIVWLIQTIKIQRIEFYQYREEREEFRSELNEFKKLAEKVHNVIHLIKAADNNLTKVFNKYKGTIIDTRKIKTIKDEIGKVKDTTILNVQSINKEEENQKIPAETILDNSELNKTIYHYVK